MDHPTDKPLAPASATAPAPASSPGPSPPSRRAPANESVEERRRCPATLADGQFMAEILRHTETKIKIPPAAWPKIAAARGLTTRWGQIKRKLGLNTTAKPLPESANRVRKVAAGKRKAATEISLAAKRAAVGVAEDLNNLQDDTDHSEDEAGPSPSKKLKTEEAVVKMEEDKDKDEDEKKPVVVKEEEAEEVKKEEEEEEEKKPLVKSEDDWTAPSR
ncbi:hypothetical protein DL764_001122 [Monosporascus ibericus]|uniref:Uncharacterized protein n=1 Tax=Monosporascus ibericus TaxID=155417 RepID=A0A4Q4TQT6_9PEZI|nr:hypothetical protein DL764_001122 [Monosporascus ibericus]